MVSGRAARATARRLGLTVDEAEDIFSGIDDPSVRQVVAGVAADQPSRAVGRASEAASEGLSKSALFVGGGAGTLGAGIAGEQFLENQQVNRRAEFQERQQEWARRLVNNPDVPREQKRRIIEQLLESGAIGDIDLGGGDGDDGGNDFLSNVIGDSLFSVRGAVILIALYFGGKALVEAAGRGGGS